MACGNPSSVALSSVLLPVGTQLTGYMVCCRNGLVDCGLSIGVLGQISQVPRSADRSQVTQDILGFLARDFPVGCCALGIALMHQQAGMQAVESGRVAAVVVDSLTHRYGQSIALNDFSLTVPQGAIFGVLGPNGSGKSTLFRLLSTLVPIQSGKVTICGCDAATEQQLIRDQIGVVFQSPSLDRKLTARENIQFQAALYGISRLQASQRISELSEALGIVDHLDQKVDKLSGGLRRRVELVKGILHRPELLLLDEPSTGLDPLSRLELWQSLVRLQQEQGTTIVMTTHLLDEAEKCDRVAILDQGRLLVSATPEELRKSTGQMVLSIACTDPEQVLAFLEQRYGLNGASDQGMVRIVLSEATVAPMEIYESLGVLATSLTIGRPSLEDVFIRIAGKSFS